ncbi:hypothetical protein K438DRAFT_1775523 [Mycena galopus ATCC 62051]|nr:hypothetical protein K438DRAFT_1775523 [Mycena galopus ATCC 62051]
MLVRGFPRTTEHNHRAMYTVHPSSTARTVDEVFVLVVHLEFEERRCISGRVKLSWGALERVQVARRRESRTTGERKFKLEAVGRGDIGLKTEECDAGPSARFCSQDRKQTRGKARRAGRHQGSSDGGQRRDGKQLEIEYLDGYMSRGARVLMKRRMKEACDRIEGSWTARGIAMKSASSSEFFGAIRDRPQENGDQDALNDSKQNHETWGETEAARLPGKPPSPEASLKIVPEDEAVAEAPDRHKHSVAVKHGEKGYEERTAGGEHCRKTRGNRNPRQK